MKRPSIYAAPAGHIAALADMVSAPSDGVGGMETRARSFAKGYLAL
jgi:hypothetical protein